MVAAKESALVPYYQSNLITLYNAKYEEILPFLTSYTIDALITDPPYANTNLKWDKPVNWPFFWTEAHRLCKPKSPMVLFCSGKFMIELANSNWKHFRYELIWCKNLAVGHLSANQRPLRAHETILLFSQAFRGSTYNPQMVPGKAHTIGKGNQLAHYSTANKKLESRTTNLYHPRSLLDFKNRSSSKSLHPTQKPLDLMKWLILTYTNRGDLVLEPFAGSGATLVAAAYHGRRVIGIEQSEEYCEIIAQRLEKGD